MRLGQSLQIGAYFKARRPISKHVRWTSCWHMMSILTSPPPLVLSNHGFQESAAVDLSAGYPADRSGYTDEYSYQSDSDLEDVDDDVVDRECHVITGYHSPRILAA